MDRLCTTLMRDDKWPCRKKMPLGYLGIGKRITLRWIFRKLCIRTGPIRLNIGISGGLLLIW